MFSCTEVWNINELWSVNGAFKHCHAHCTVMLYNDCISHVNLNNGKCLFLCGMGYTACLVYNACAIAKSVLYMPCTFDFISCWTYQGVECTHCLIAVNYLLDCLTIVYIPACTDRYTYYYKLVTPFLRESFSFKLIKYLIVVSVKNQYDH